MRWSHWILMCGAMVAVVAGLTVAQLFVRGML